jgi:hypothetical protein
LPYILSWLLVSADSQAFNWGAKSGWFWFGIGLFCVGYTFFRVPETKDRTYLELDKLFQDRVPARKFRATKLDRESHDAFVVLGLWLIFQSPHFLVRTTRSSTRRQRCSTSRVYLLLS